MSHWCETHNRRATYRGTDGNYRCDPRLGGIMLACHVVECNELNPPDESHAITEKQFHKINLLETENQALKNVLERALELLKIFATSNNQGAYCSSDDKILLLKEFRAAVKPILIKKHATDPDLPADLEKTLA